MSRGTLITAVVGVGVVLGCLSVATGTTYMPGPAPSCVLYHETVEDVPEPRDRSEIGCGEEVTCWIDDWQDTDWEMLPEGGHTEVQDTMGDVQWCTYGAGTVDPEWGTTTTLSADSVDNDTSVYVYAYVHDSGDKGLDNSVMVSAGFAVRKPTNIRVYFWEDAPAGDWTKGPPDNNMGAISKFYYQVLPATVNFNKMQVRENILEQSSLWPCGFYYTKYAEVKTVTLTSAVVGGVKRPNMLADSVGLGLYDKGFLWDGSAYLECWHIIDIPFEYKTTQWRPFKTITHVKRFATTFKAQMAVSAYNFLYGAEQGPWQ